MIALIREWVLGLCAAAVYAAICINVMPKGPVKTVGQLLAGGLMALALLGPLSRWEGADIALQLARYRDEAAAISQRAEEQGQEWERTFIAGELETYIEDKAQALGAAVKDAAVTLRWSPEGCWVPRAVTIEGDYHPQLAALLEAELGVPVQAQQWRSDGQSHGQDAER